MSASRVAPRLWQGSIPPEGTELARRGFCLLVLAAAEHQPPAHHFPGVAVLHAPFDDARPSPGELAIAEQAAGVVAAHVMSGDRVLVTCRSGWNRSGLICARALIMLGATPRSAVRKVRAARGPRALGNQHFVAALVG